MPKTYETAFVEGFQNELTKIAKNKLSGLSPFQKALGLMAVGGVGYESVRRANQDRRMGRVMRIQQGGY